jgi:hypothetical protein
MSREQAKDFAARLPRIVPKEEADISQLDDELADVLYPGRRSRPLRIGVRFDAFGGENYPRAIEIARRSPVYRETHVGDRLEHFAAFDADAFEDFRELHAIVGPITGTDLLVDGKRLPYAVGLWLPLFQLFWISTRRREA